MSLNYGSLAISLDGEVISALDPQVSDLVRAVIISLFTWRRANPDDNADQLNGWWGDTFAEVLNDRIGSRLWLLMRAKITGQTLLLAKEYASEALQWLLDDGVASRVDVTVERFGIDGVAIGCAIYRADGSKVDLRFNDAWGFLNAV